VNICFQYLEYIPKSGIVGSYITLYLNVLRI